MAWEREAGLDSDEWLQDLVFDARTVSVADHLFKVVDILYQRSEHSIFRLPPGWCTQKLAVSLKNSGWSRPTTLRWFQANASQIAGSGSQTELAP